jgi:disulfide bond formation protein DsbB
MIQRIQTIWLLVASVLAFTTLSASFYSGNILVDNAKVFQHFTAKEYTLLMVLTVVVALGSLVAVFLYKDRKLQVRIVSAAMILSIINLGIYYWRTRNFLPDEGTFDLTALIAIAIPFFLFLAMRAIYQDNKLMKSLDRLR